MAVIPAQERYIDPYADIYSNTVNHRLMSIYPSGKGIIRGLWLEVDDTQPNLLKVQSGIAIKDFVTIHIEETVIDVSSRANGEYYVVLEYNYEVVSPPPQAGLDVVLPGYEGDSVILGKITIDSGTVTDIDYTTRTRNDLIEHLENLMSSGQIQNDIDMNGHKIVNLGSDDPSTFTNDTDAVNKAYVDYVLTNVAKDINVKVDSEDSQSDYLNNKIVVGNNLAKDVRNEDLSPATSGNKHVLLISGVDDKISVITGDSTSSVLDDKIDAYNPLYKYIVDGASGKALQLKVHYDGEAESGSSEHGGQKTILTDNFTVDGESVLALYVADIFVHKTGNIDETITGNKTFQGNVTVNGDLTVEGTMTTINTQELTVEDTIITLNSSLTSGTPPNTLISGIEVLRGDEPKARFYWKESIDRWQFEEPLNVHSIHFDYPGSNSDPLAFMRVDLDTDVSVLRTIIGDNTDGQDYFEIGTNPGTWTPVFRVYNNGNAWVKGDLTIEGNVNVTGTINGEVPGAGLDTESLFYEFLLHDKPFEKIVYDVFTDDTMVKSGSPTPTYDSDNTRYLGQNGSILETNGNVIDSSTTYYYFTVHVETSKVDEGDPDPDLAIEYSLDNGTTWTECEPDTNINVSTGFTKLRLRFRYNNTFYIDSYGVCYKLQEKALNDMTKLQQGLPYKTKLTLHETFIVKDDEGCIVPDRFIVADDGELIVEDNGVFMVVSNT
ncbi:MAG: hypothetical protein DRN30_02065 [Thermoplasmata archaeon]|nr:MAG: hypothetical protein DRN30_02065 [Thermoplasmata archaeon]